jgi:hypothetical protein
MRNKQTHIFKFISIEIINDQLFKYFKNQHQIKKKIILIIKMKSSILFYLIVLVVLNYGGNCSKNTKKPSNVCEIADYNPFMRSMKLIDNISLRLTRRKNDSKKDKNNVKIRKNIFDESYFDQNSEIGEKFSRLDQSKNMKCYQKGKE